MFLKKTHSKNKTYYSIAETYRESGKVKHRILGHLGSLDSLNKQQIRNLVLALLKAIDSKDIVVNPEEIQETERQNWGAVAVYQKLWQKFDLDSLLQRSWQYRHFEFDALRSVFLMLLDRVILPSSKLKTFNTQTKYFGLSPVSLQHLYRSLDLLADSKDEIEAGVFRKNVSLFNLTVDVVFYDVTTFYFESQKNDALKTFGFSKDNKINEVQVVMGLLMDGEGRPVGFDLYPGNTFEGKTLETALDKLKERFKIGKVILVADRGLCSANNMALLKAKDYDYIVGAKLKTMSKAFQQQALDLSGYETIEQPAGEPGIRYKVLFEGEDRIVCTWTEKRARKDKADRERLLQKAEEMLKTPSKITGKRGARKYLKTSTETQGLDLEKIKADEAWDGIYGIRTSTLELTPLDIYNAYHQLWKIEECFRVLKTNLETRPIYHWTPKRIKGHFVLCFLAFLLERTLELLLKQENIDYSVEKIRLSLDTLELSVVKIGQEDYLLRPNPDELATNILRILEIKQPKPFQPFVV